MKPASEATSFSKQARAALQPSTAATILGLSLL